MKPAPAFSIFKMYKSMTQSWYRKAVEERFLPRHDLYTAVNSLIVSCFPIPYFPNAHCFQLSGPLLFKCSLPPAPRSPVSGSYPSLPEIPADSRIFCSAFLRHPLQATVFQPLHHFFRKNEYNRWKRPGKPSAHSIPRISYVNRSNGCFRCSR